MAKRIKAVAMLSFVSAAGGLVAVMTGLVLLLGCTELRAQTTTATLSGMVRDQSGGVIPEAKISLKNAATGVTRTTTTDAQGHYSLLNLDPGSYLLRVEHAGFKTAEQRGVVLTVGGSSNVDLTMPVGELSEVVEVKQEVPLIEPAKAEVSRVVTELSIASLPIIGRNFVDFAKLSSGPGKHWGRGFQGAGHRSGLGGGATAVVRGPD